MSYVVVLDVNSTFMSVTFLECALIEYAVYYKSDKNSKARVISFLNI